MPPMTLRAIFRNPSRNFPAHVPHIPTRAIFSLFLIASDLTIVAKTAKRNYPEHFRASHFLPQTAANKFPHAKRFKPLHYDTVFVHKRTYFVHKPPLFVHKRSHPARKTSTSTFFPPGPLF
jgi:hypothetical protein